MATMEFKIIDCTGPLAPMGDSVWQHTEFRFYPEPAPDLEEVDETLLSARVLHHFVRQFGWRLDWELLRPMFNCMQKVYISKKMRKENLDFNILRADLLHNFEMNAGVGVVEIGHYMLSAGDSLETLGRFEEASSLYCDIASHYAIEDASEASELEVSCFTRAGIALQRAGMYKEAFQMYAKALQAADKMGLHDLQEDNFSFPIGHMLTLYHDAHLAAIGKRKVEGPFIATAEEKLWPAIMLLLEVIDFRPHSKNSMELQEILDWAKQRFGRYLKPRLQEPEFAERLLRAMFKTGDYSKHELMLLSALQPDHMVLFKGRDFNSDSQEPRRNAGIKAAQTFVKDQFYEGSQFLVLCENCHQMEPKAHSFKRCPCQYSYYCSKTCQTTHWKTHKKTCSWFLKKQDTEIN